MSLSVHRFRVLTPLLAVLCVVVALVTAPPAAAADPDSPPLTYFGPARQLITVVADSASSTTATLTAWERTDAGWRTVVGPVRAFVGQAGIGQASEGSSKTPAGVFSLGQAFGRQPNPGTAMPYFTTDGYDWWNGNVNSPAYNTHVRQATNPGGASENLYGAGSVYDYAIDMGYNTARVPGAGSAMFLHVTDGAPSAGCVAIDRAALVSILRWLDPAKNPVIDIAVANAATRSPVGYLDSATVTTSSATGTTARVAGWAVDPDRLRAPIDVHVYDFRPDGSSQAVAIRADRTRTDLPAGLPGVNAEHGYAASLQLTGSGRHTVCAYGINVDTGSNSSLGCVPFDVRAPIGSFDGAGMSGGRITLAGWAADPWAPGQTLQLSATVTGPAGVSSSVLTTGGSRPDVAAAYPWAGGGTGFSGSLPVQGDGTHQVCVSVSATSIGCRDVAVRNAFGYLDYAAASAGAITVVGWALNPNSPGERVEIHVYDDGPGGSVGRAGYRADQPRPDVAAAFPGYDTGHGYAVTIPAAPGGHRVCTYAITTGGGFANTLLGCRELTVSG